MVMVNRMISPLRSRWARSPDLAAEQVANKWGLPNDAEFDLYTRVRGLRRTYRVRYFRSMVLRRVERIKL